MNIMKFKHPFVKVLSSSLYDLPAPSSLNYFWNFGSLLALNLMIQVVSGLFLSMHYLNSVGDSFESVLHIMKDLDSGFIYRVVHMNGASFFFVLVYFHIGRGLFFGSYKATYIWISGILILLILMGISFLGYVLPWGQMSFWGATVITNLVSALPYVGYLVVEWLWGGYSVSGVTLSRFFSFHFLLPFVLMGAVLVHLVFLHETGSSNSVSMKAEGDKISFGPYYIVKDLMGVFFFFFFFIFFFLLESYLFGDPENFNPANPLSTPVHIQPEWYFLFAYAILRSIPSKLGGVVALLMSILFFLFHSLILSEYSSNKFFFIKKWFYWFFIGIFFLLTWVGAKPVEYPYEFFSRGFGLFYFLFGFLLLI